MTRNPIRDFLLFCSGANQSILNRKECHVERNKYAGIGGTILFTAVLAVLSGSYAMFTVFNGPKRAIVFGLLWGLIIFNLDRFIVSSIRKAHLEANATPAAQRAAKRQEWKKAFPRLLLALFISIVITKPLELRFFAVEIDGQMTKALTALRKENEDPIRAEYADIATREDEVNTQRQRLLDLETERNTRIRAARGEAEGFEGTYAVGYGPNWAKRQAEKDQAEAELDAARKSLGPLIGARETEIQNRKNERDQKIAAANATIDSSRGLLRKLEALSSLRSGSWSVFWVSNFLVLLFIALETAPITVKLFSSRGPYDDCLETIEHEVYATQREIRSNKNDEINTRNALSRQRNAERLVAEVPLGMSAFQTISPVEFKDAQEEVAKEGIRLWKMRQLSYLKATAGRIQQPMAPASGHAQGNSGSSQPTGPQPAVTKPTAAGAGAPQAVSSTVQIATQPGQTPGAPMMTGSASAVAPTATAAPPAQPQGNGKDPSGTPAAMNGNNSKDPQP